MAEQEQSRRWGTWEELLLASAVKRHGFQSWDSVAMELQSRTTLPHLLTTPHICKKKYHDLNRRFTDNRFRSQDDAVPWLDELRKLRVAELRLEVQRRDVSILSLQLKVKRLEEERHEQSLKEDQNGEGKPDLEGERSENDKKDEPEKVDAKFVTGGEESDRDNRSFNESNSTGMNIKTGEEGEDKEHEPAGTGSGKPDPVCIASKPAGENSYNESSDSIVKNMAFGVNERSQVKKGGDSAAQSKGERETKESSEVQSSVSLRGKRKRKRKREVRRRKEVSDGSGSEELAANSEGLVVGLLEMIRAHKNSSLFERRLQVQEGDRYKNMVRRHLDLETIQTRFEQNLYSSSSPLSFYRDLLLLFNNAIVFFPKSSPESTSAHQLRNLVSNHIKKSDSSNIPSPSPPIHLIQTKHKTPTIPIIVCRKRSSISAKPSSSTSFGPRNEEKKQVDDVNVAKEKAITGARSLRRSNNNVSPKKDKKRNESSMALEKKRSAADFLKRIKRNSPVGMLKSEGVKENGKGKDRVLRINGRGGKRHVMEDNSPSKRSVGRPPKKTAAEGSAEGKRLREGGGGGGGEKDVEAVKRPRKRSRR